MTAYEGGTSTTGPTNGGASPAAETHPAIKIVLGRPQDWISSAVASLSRAPDLFVRDTELVHVTRTSEEEAAESAWVDGRGRKQFALVAGSPKIHALTLPGLRVRMAQWATWERPVMVKGQFEDRPCEPTKAMAEEVRDERHWRGIRGLVGVSETPFPRPDMSIVQGESRYDRATGYLYEPSMPFLLVDPTSSPADATVSYEALIDLFSDFPFASPAGSSAAVALLLTMLARPAILGPVPAWIVGATTQGTGKSLIVDLCATIAYGRDAGRDPFPSTTGRSGDDELRKQLGFLARTGTPLVFFDNCDDAMIGSDSLEQIITAPRTYRFRVLGLSEGLLLAVRMIFAFSANNPQWSRGMNRRTLVIDLASPFAKPEHRPLDSYAHPDRAGRLLAYAAEHRAEYVHHALVILAAYAHAGFPNRLSLGTFDEWAGIIPSAIVHAGGEDPMLCRPGADGEETPDTLQRQTLAIEWDAFCRDSGKVDGITAHDLVERLYPSGGERGQPLEAKWEILRGAIEFFVPPRNPGQAPDPRVLGEVMRRRMKGAPVMVADAPAPLRRFVAAEKKSGGRARWKVADVPQYKAKSGAAKDRADAATKDRELIERIRREEASGP